MNRTALTFASAAIVGTVFLKRYPFPESDALVQLILQEKPYLFHALRGGWVVMLFSTPALAFSGIFSLVFIFASSEGRRRRSQLPPYARPSASDPLHLVMGEVHHPRKATPAEDPHWLTISERGLFTGIAIFGAIGSGKTSGCMRPYATQILSWRAKDPERKVGGIILEVKGDFCHQVRHILEQAGRGEDYVEISLDSKYSYNPLENDLDAFALAYSIASLLNNLYGRGKEPFWQQAYTNLVKFIILLHKVVDEYCTLFQVYECAINPERLKQKMAQGEALFAALAAAPADWIVIDPAAYLKYEELASFKWETWQARMRSSHSEILLEQLTGLGIDYEIVESEERTETKDVNDRLAQFEAVKRWFEHDWMRIDTKLRTSIVEGISVFLSIFDDNPALKRVFCPPKECYDRTLNANGRYGVPLPPFRELIEQGKVVALNFPVGANAATARAVGCLLKLDFERAMLNRIPMMERHPERHFREALFLCDEYQAFATVGESDPTGDEKFFALARQSKCIAITATQSISSLRSTLPGESWRTLLQTFRTKIFLALSDDFSAKTASDLCGRDEQLVPSYSLSESGHDVRVSTLTGRALAHRAGVTVNKNYALMFRPIFEPKQFMELRNAQAIVLAYDGLNPLPPQLCYLKPYYLDPNLSYFEQLERGLL
jgi:hypothetical protein